MFDQFHYVPLLKAKAGEMRAFQDLPDADRDFITPLLEVVPIPWDFDEDRPAKTLRRHLQTLVPQTLKSWGTERMFFVDLGNIAEDDVVNDGEFALQHVMDAYRTGGAQAIPVTGINRGANYQHQVSQVVRHDGRGVCIRVAVDEMGSPQRLWAYVSELLDRLQLRADVVDLLLDFETIRSSQVGLLVSQAAIMVEALTTAASWRTVTLASGAFPDTLQNVGADAIDLIARSDWAAWQSLVIGDGADLGRYPAFGDYGITGVAFSEVDPRVMKMSANLRYTADDVWVVLKGRNVRDHGYDQFRRLCAALVRRAEFAGEDFSAGDRFIGGCARGELGPGSATTWRQVGTNHHLTLVARAQATLSLTSSNS